VINTENLGEERFHANLGLDVHLVLDYCVPVNVDEREAVRREIVAGVAALEVVLQERARTIARGPGSRRQLHRTGERRGVGRILQVLRLRVRVHQINCERRYPKEHDQDQSEPDHYDAALVFSACAF
jgi:hypothetical protein